MHPLTRRPLTLLAWIGCCIGLGWTASSAQAQQGRPSDSRLEAPTLLGVDARDEEEPILPPLALPDPMSTSAAASDVRVFVRAYHVIGSRLLSSEEIDALTQPYRGRMVSYADLQRVRDALTQAYVERGYLTSGAVLPEQSIRDATVRIEVHEGTLDDVAVKTDGRLLPSYVADRLRPDRDEPLHLATLQERLRELQADRLVRSVRASLVPGERRGRARIDVELEEERALRARLAIDNGLSPSIGAERASLTVEHWNLSGRGDAIELYYAKSAGLRELRGSYSLPISSKGTRLELEVRSSRSEVIEGPFDDLDIESRAVTYGVQLRHPLWTTPGRTLGLSLGGEIRRSKSFLLGSAFSFSPGAEEGESKITVLRFAQELSLASRTQALALRSTFSLGLGALGATTQRGARVPDSRFVSWLGQAQYARRLPWADAQLVVRADIQLSDDPLLGLEQFSIGGRYTVRGYRENARVRDNGAVGSVELRIPVWRARRSSAALELAPFVDAGVSWNRRERERGGKTLASVGVGARLVLGSISWELTFAHAIRDLRLGSDERDLQDRGIHLGMTARF